MSEKESSRISIGFFGLLTLLFIGLKLTGHIAWSWVWVLSPIWITLLIVVVLILLVFIGVFLYEILKR